MILNRHGDFFDFFVKDDFLVQNIYFPLLI